MAQQAGRILCPRCGANNFDSVPACWKCGAQLKATAAAPPYVMPDPVLRASPERSAAWADSTPQADPAAARRAALALAISLPWIGLPVGWIFMMIEDPRRQAIGRYCALWSGVSMLIQCILLVLSLGSIGALLGGALLKPSGTSIPANPLQSQGIAIPGLGGDTH